MPLPLAPIAVFALRTGVAAAAVWAVRTAWAARQTPGRTDQRAEDALDAMDEGLALHRPADRRTDDESQTNAAARFRRTIRWGKRGVEVDAALLGRLRIRRV
ncbi:hypothetical protein GEU84_012350 [Fertoebacter nigrum]|uniref:Uncharacterized protein n=1 Tax=Fertoeibacter niger TaxID=2656921 RepID=A0A8X8H2V0_9RHOB|nr:hypothetical protein [Fertoeibacter niger]NUB45182.1 hypothetical protein [Fertoeibacter niger]